MRLSKKGKRNIRRSLYLLGFVFAAMLSYFFITAKPLYITTVEVDNKEYENAIQSVVQDTLEGHTFYIFPSRHSVFVPKKGLITKLEATFPEIKDITITRRGLETLAISVTLRTPVFRMENGLAVDEEGVVYQDPDDISLLPTFSFLNSFPDKEHISLFISFAKKLSLFIEPVSGIFLTEDNDVRYLLHSTTTYVVTQYEADSTTSWSTFLSAASTEPLKSLLENKKNTLEYIDLRFGNKVFYKFKDQNISGNTKSGTTTQGIASSTPSH